MKTSLEYEKMLIVALDQARQGKAEGGIPIGAALFDDNGTLLGAGRNRRVQLNDPAMHAETNAFQAAGRRRNYRDNIMVTTLSPCWYCSGLIRQFKIGTVLVGETVNAAKFSDALNWLRDVGVQVIDLNSQDCIQLISEFSKSHPDIWAEDIGE